MTYIHNEEVQPTPGIGKILDKTISDPFQQHLQDEDISENPVSILQNYTNGLPLLDVHILEGLWKTSNQESAMGKMLRYYLFTISECYDGFLYETRAHSYF